MNKILSECIPTQCPAQGFKGVGVGVDVTSTIFFSTTAGTGVLVGSGTLGFGVGGIEVGVGGTGVAGILGKIRFTSYILTIK